MTNRNILRRLAAVATAAVTLTTTLVLQPAPALAGEGCTDGSRADARRLAADGDFTELGTTQADFSTVTLRFSAGKNCAWGLISDVARAANSRVWLDRSRDGGQNWEKTSVVETRFNKTSTYTGAYSLDGFNAVRACTVNVTLTAAAFQVRSPDGLYVGDYYCTSWY